MSNFWEIEMPLPKDMEGIEVCNSLEEAAEIVAGETNLEMRKVPIKKNVTDIHYEKTTGWSVILYRGDISEETEKLKSSIEKRDYEEDEAIPVRGEKSLLGRYSDSFYNILAKKEQEILSKIDSSRKTTKDDTEKVSEMLFPIEEKTYSPVI